MSLLGRERPTILGGDFNMTPDDPLISEILATGLRDAALEAGADGGTSEDGRRIDYIFVSEEFAVTDGAVVDTDASDHRPVALTLELP